MKYSVRYLLPVLTIATLVWFTGCADAPSPVAPETAADHAAIATGGQSFFVVSGLDVQPAGKWIPGGVWGEGAATLTRAIGQWGGMLLVSTDGPFTLDSRVVSFSVPPHAIPEEDPWGGEVDITMSVSGSKLSEMVITFDPSGLFFLTSALLRIQTQSYFNDVEPGDITIIHFLDDDGDHIYEESSEKVIFEVVVDESGTITIDVQVDGFSRYSLPPGA